MIAFRVREEADSSAGPKLRKSLTDRRNNTSLKTVAVLPVSRHVPVDVFGRKLHAALEAAGASTTYLDQALVSDQDHLGKHAFAKVGKLKAVEVSDCATRRRFLCDQFLDPYVHPSGQSDSIFSHPRIYAVDMVGGLQYGCWDGR